MLQIYYAKYKKDCRYIYIYIYNTYCTVNYRLEVQQRKNSVSKELEDYKADNHKFMQEMNTTITQGKQDHITLSNEVMVTLLMINLQDLHNGFALPEF
jgi:hypothetical protein